MCSALVVRIAAGVVIALATTQPAGAGKCDSRSIVAICIKGKFINAASVLQGIKDLRVWIAVRDGAAGSRSTNLNLAGSSGGTCESKPDAELDNCKAVQSIFNEKVGIQSCTPSKWTKTVLNTPVDVFLWGAATCTTTEITIENQKYQINKISSVQDLKGYVKRINDYCGGCQQSPDLGTAELTSSGTPNVTIQETAVYRPGAEMKYRCKGEQAEKTTTCSGEMWTPVECPELSTSKASLIVGVSVGVSACSSCSVGLRCILLISLGAVVLTVVRGRKQARSASEKPKQNTRSCHQLTYSIYETNQLSNALAVRTQKGTCH